MEENLALKSIKIARKFIALNKTEEAIKAYTIAAEHNKGENPEIDVEAALFVFNNKGNYKFSYTIFINLYNKGFYQDEILDILIEAFYTPNAVKIQKKYNKNVKLLKEYKYIFKTDFCDFDDLKIKFFPFDDDGFVPFFPEENRFGEYINVNDPIIDRYFFKDLENPILAKDVYSQYQLEYLYDNVRRSEWVAKDNHIYLHYTDFATLCAYLQVLNFGNLLAFQKIVFLIEDEISCYPIDFKEKFSIDYSEYTVKPISVSEVHRLIWHTQLSSHNGGDFFNEILDEHPNLIMPHSIMFDSVTESLQNVYDAHKQDITNVTMEQNGKILNISKYLKFSYKITIKDCFVAYNLALQEIHGLNNDISRIAPVVVFQPHFENIISDINIFDNNYALYNNDKYNKIKKHSLFKSFKYIKTFTPMRRISTSFAAANRYSLGDLANRNFSPSDFNSRIINRSFYVDKFDRLYKDSILVRFEDGKLNPTATFTALAEFLDIPYTDSMKNCSFFGVKDVKSAEDNVIGFDTSSVYKQYEEYAYDYEKYLIEYLFRDIYKLYGYDFMFYDGKELTFDELANMINKPWKIEMFDQADALEKYIEKIKEKAIKGTVDETIVVTVEERNKVVMREIFNLERNTAILNASIIYRNPKFLNKEGQPLIPMKLLKLNPDLLEQPLYK